MLNELRVQYAHRHQSRTTNDLSGTGPAITISGVANFGGPYQGAQDAEFDFKQNIWQVIDNFTCPAGQPQLQDRASTCSSWSDARATTPRLAYTFSSIDTYLAAKQRRQPARLLDVPAVPRADRLRDEHVALQRFVQDDWRDHADVQGALRRCATTSTTIPRAIPSAPFEYSRELQRRPNNFGPAPRRGLVARPDKDGAAREHGHHVRPAAAGGLRERGPVERRAAATR